MKKLQHFFSNINWKKVGKYSLFYLQAFLLILARLIYLLVYELAKFLKKAGIFSYALVNKGKEEFIRRKIWPKTKRALHLGAAITWLLSKKFTKEVVKQTKAFVVFITPYVKKYTKLTIKYTTRFYKRSLVIVTYILLRIQKTDSYKKLEKTTQQKVVKPLLRTAASRKPYAIALMVILFITSSFVFLHDKNSFAATNTWTQTDWSGGQGSSTTNQYASASGVATSTSLSLLPGTWPYKKTITIDSDQVSGSSDLTNFPLLYSVTDVDLKSIANGGYVAQSDGGDIKFVASDGTTKLDHEIEKYDPATGELIAWVRIPTLSYNSDTTLYIFYGNDAGSLDESNAAGVWPTDEYVGVYHLNEDATAGQSTATHYDSTSNSNDGTQSGNNNTTGIIGTGQQTDTYNDDIYFNSINDELDEPLDVATISFWLKKNVDNNSAIALSLGLNGYDRVWFYNFSTQWQFTRSASAGASKAVIFDESATPIGEWKHVTMTWDIGADELKAFVNGTQQGSTATGNDSFAGTFSSQGAVQLGGFAGANFYGSYDELKVHRVVRSSDWLTTEYNNQSDPSSFFSTGSQGGNYTTTSVGGSWAFATWPYRNAITIDNTQVSGSSNLTNFPVLINTTNTDWRSAANGGYVAQSDGGDILFSDSSGNKLDHEIESYTASTGALVAWVEVPALDYDDDTTLYVYYGNNQGSLTEENPAGVWPADNYAGVWHLSEGDSTDADYYKDSTPNDNDGTLTDADGDTIATTGKIGGAVDLAGDADYIEIADNDSLSFGDGATDQTLSFSSWINMDVVSNFITIAKSNEYQHRNYITYPGFILTDDSTGGTLSKRGTTLLNGNVNQWMHMVTTYDGSGGVKIYVNSVEQGVTDISSGSYTAMENTSNTVRIGNLSSLYSNGEIDNVVIYKGELSPDWIATEYNNQNDPSSFYTVGSLDTGYTTKLISAAFDTGTASSLVSQISWTESLPANTDIKFQIRTSADGTTWGNFLGPTDGTDFYTNAAGGETINSTHADGSGDRYIQYLVLLTTTDSSATPTLSDVSIQYTANGAPDFNPDYPSASAGGAQVSNVATDGNSTVTIQYSVRDTDTSSGTVTPGYITPSFEYSLNGGSTWADVSTSTLASGDWDNKVVDESNYNIYSATWSAEEQIGTSVYVTNAKIRVKANDNEGGNNIATTTTAGFTLDTTSPALGATPMTVDASVSPAYVTLSCTDDTALEQQIGLASDLSGADYETYTGTTTVAGVGTPTDVVYGRCRDAYGNTTAIQSVTTPTQPTNMYYQDISNVSESDYALFISWSTVPEPSAGFAGYKLYRSTDGSNYSLYQTIATRTTNYYIDTGLSTGTTYYYKLFVQDDDGNKSAYSAVVSDNPDGVGGTDNTPPTISLVSATSTPMEATIAWTTDELSNSTVYYSATTSDPGTDSGNYALSQGVGSYVTSHSVALSNLTPNTQYYYLVRSTDVQNNIGTDSSSGTFTTGAGVSISSVSASTIYNEEAIITWNTDSAADSTVYYSTNSDMSSAASINSATEVTGHSVTLEGLTGGTTYYFYVESETGGNTTSDKNVVDGVTEYYSFTTTSDATAPTISGVNNALIGETGVTIAWTTNEGATSQVFWGRNTSLGSTTTETAVYTTQHAVTISGLDVETTYYYKVRSEDRAGNASVDDNSGALYTVQTNPLGGGGGGVLFLYESDSTAPTTNNVTASPSNNSATITFTTDEPAGVLFGWGAGDASENEINKTNVFQTSHVFVVEGLLPETRYYYKIVTKDVSGNERVRNGSFITLSGDDPNLITDQPQQPSVDLGDIDTEREDPVDQEGDTTEVPADTNISELTRNAAAGTVREVLESVFQNSNLFSIPSDFLLDAASKLAQNFDHSVVSNEDLKKADQEFLFENLRIAAVTGQNATVVWRTTVPTKSIIYLTDLRTGQTRELSDPSFLLAHEYTINRLEPTSSYSLQVVAENELGERLGSQSLSFSTFVDRSDPVISELRTTTSILPGKENKVQAIVSWKTNKPATSRVLYEAGVSTDDDFAFSSANNQSYTYEHVVVVSGLQPGQVYRIRAESVDGQGTSVYSTDRTLITPRSKESIVDVIIENFEQTFGFLR